MNQIIKNNRFTLPSHFVIGFCSISTLLRLTLLIWVWKDLNHNPIYLLKTCIIGLGFDLASAAFLILPMVVYLYLTPSKITGSLFDKIVLYFLTTLLTLISVLTFFSELTFWEEFKTRFNFIAVDYLIYTHEVVANIQESYPIPLLLTGSGIVVGMCLYLFVKSKSFERTFVNKTNFTLRSLVFFLYATLLIGFTSLYNNSSAEWSDNRYLNEISKSGVYSFFAAFRNNQLKYDQFYNTIPQNTAFELSNRMVHPQTPPKPTSITHNITAKTPNAALHPNVIVVLMESMSGSFMKAFDQQENLTPNLDAMARDGLFFTNLYATGTRTVRGMEALALSIPPTPGQSIVKRPDNQGLFTIGSVFKDKGYTNNFFYGGDGYFDNMNKFWGGNGFNIYDRGNNTVLTEDIQTQRFHIPDEKVHFKNAWGICDEDLFDAVIEASDKMYKENKSFFNFALTASNHRPYTYPEHTIDIPSGTGRNGAVKYADYAIGAFIKKARTKPWFKNTVFVFVADHCASSAGKDEIDIPNYHIPAIIYNLPDTPPMNIDKQCSQIDVMPTLFEKLNWSYTSNFYGQDVLDSNFQERALMGTYRKLTLMKKQEVVILSDQHKNKEYHWDKTKNTLNPTHKNQRLLQEAIAYYQTADFLFNTGGLKEKTPKTKAVTVEDNSTKQLPKTAVKATKKLRNS